MRRVLNPNRLAASSLDDSTQRRAHRGFNLINSRDDLKLAKEINGKFLRFSSRYISGQSLLHVTLQKMQRERSQADEVSLSRRA